MNLPVVLHPKHLPVTCCKDFDMLELWDDRARRVEFNTGRPL